MDPSDGMVLDALAELDADPADPRPPGHYGRFRNAAWYYVSDDLARTVMLGPAIRNNPQLPKRRY
ncbi:hypothetical protein EKH57_00520 (plasmid) [Halorubrum sp. BOL3-1]|nr:hypothetical protein EKH57_00520 [Halorubrum sp. BOL3-1]